MLSSHTVASLCWSALCTHNLCFMCFYSGGRHFIPFVLKRMFFFPLSNRRSNEGKCHVLHGLEGKKTHFGIICEVGLYVKRRKGAKKKKWWKTWRELIKEGMCCGIFFWEQRETGSKHFSEPFPVFWAQCWCERHFPVFTVRNLGVIVCLWEEASPFCPEEPSARTGPTEDF